MRAPGRALGAPQIRPTRARFFPSALLFFIRGKIAPTRRALRIVAGCENILDKCIDVETNLSVDTSEFRESERRLTATAATTAFGAFDIKSVTSRDSCKQHAVVIVESSVVMSTEKKKTELANSPAYDRPVFRRDKWNSLFNKETSGLSRKFPGYN